MSKPTHCPGCGSLLQWERIDVDAGAGQELPEEAMEYADCTCGLGLTLNALPPEVEDQADVDEGQMGLFDQAAA